MAKQTVAEQLIEFIYDNTTKINREDFCTLEFVIIKGNLDGMRTKEYTKAKKSDADWTKRVAAGVTSKT